MGEEVGVVMLLDGEIPEEQKVGEIQLSQVPDIGGIPPSVVGKLAGRRIAVLGLDRSELEDISSSLLWVDAIIRPFDLDIDLEIDAPDLVIADIKAIAMIPEYDLDAIFSGIPLLVLGTPDEVHQTSLPGLTLTDFVNPPIESAELALRICRLIERSKPSRRSPSGKREVLIADDDPFVSTFVQRALETEGICVRKAKDGEEALQQARDEKPGVVLLDVNMPARNGFEVLQVLKSSHQTADIPVVMLTSQSHEADVLRGFKLGVEDFVAKPFNPKELIARIVRIFERPVR